jgi:hypothetical protein
VNPTRRCLLGSHEDLVYSEQWEPCKASGVQRQDMGNTLQKRYPLHMQPMQVRPSREEERKSLPAAG